MPRSHYPRRQRKKQRHREVKQLAQDCTDSRCQNHMLNSSLSGSSIWLSPDSGEDLLSQIPLSLATGDCANPTFLCTPETSLHHPEFLPPSVPGDPGGSPAWLAWEPSVVHLIFPCYWVILWSCKARAIHPLFILAPPNPWQENAYSFPHSCICLINVHWLLTMSHSPCWVLGYSSIEESLLRLIVWWGRWTKETSKKQI